MGEAEATFGTEALAGLLERLELQVTPLRDGGEGFEATLRTRFGPLDSRWIWYPGPGLLEVQHRLAFQVPEPRHAAMADAVCRLNTRMVGPALEFDPDQSTLAIRCVQAVLDVPPSEQQLRLLTELGPSTAERFYLGLQAIAFRGRSFDEAFPTPPRVN